MSPDYSNLNQKYISNKDVFPEIYRLTQQGMKITMPLRGRSMRPFLEDNRDKALFVKLNNPKVGDPILAEVSKDFFVLHRIVKIENDDVTLLGDGNMKPEHCKLEDLRCSVLGFYRKGRKTLDPVNGWKWRTYSFIWMRLRPVRRWLLYIHRRVWLKFFKQYKIYEDVED